MLGACSMNFGEKEGIWIIGNKARGRETVRNLLHVGRPL
jgi:hypothetical protein